jgi:homoserine dehydrogenase
VSGHHFTGAIVTKKIVVLKFGSSVLRNPEHVPDAVHEIYRHVRRGWRVIAVVSAFEGATPALLSAAERYGPSPDAHALATLAASGEQVASAHLTLALDQFGIPARIVDPRELEFEAQGQPLDAEPVRISTAVAKALLATGAVLIVPGFFAVDTGGRCVLLGRGGSDHTALFVANALEADCVLLKDKWCHVSNVSLTMQQPGCVEVSEARTAHY